RVNIGAAIVNSERDIAHQSYAALLGISLHGPPLRVSDPLHIGIESSALSKPILHHWGLLRVPGRGHARTAMFLPPLIPSFPISVHLHQGAEKRVVREP